MPATYWVVVLLLGIVIILLAVNTVNIRWLRREAIERERRDEATEAQVLRLLARSEEQPDGKDDAQAHRTLWLVPPAVITALTMAGGWLRHNSGPMGATLAGVAAVTVLVIVGSSTSDTHPAEPPARPAIVAPPTTTVSLSPSLTSELSPPGPEARLSGGGTPTSAPSTVATTRGMVPPIITVTTVTTTTTPTVTTTPQVTTPTTPQRCLLRVKLIGLADVCVPALS